MISCPSCTVASISGSLSIQANGSLTVKSIQGELSILDQDHVVLASLPSRETLTIPSAIVSGKQRVMVAQVGDIEEEDMKSGDGKSDERWSWEGLSVLVGGWGTLLLNAGMVGLIVASAIDDDDDNTPICK